jgi:inner membrane protein
MASVYTHALVGLGMGKLGIARPMPVLFWILTAVLPILPDLDVFSDARYGTIYGHRGITHSLLFALFLGMTAAGATYRYFKIDFWPLSGFFFVIVAAHGLLEVCTTGGPGIAFFWPVDNRRIGPWGYLPFSDIGFEIPNPRINKAVGTEIALVWVPMIVTVGVVIIARRIRRGLRPPPIDASA